MIQQHPLPSLSESEWATSTKLLTDAISASNHLAVHSLLFSSFDPDAHVPTLVNFRDRKGWSPIHYCVAAQQPNARVLDALYLSGVDLTMYTADPKNACSPLHILAREGGLSNGTSFRLYAFVVHLVRDLGAPLNAVDALGNTCLHTAAQHGSCLDVLMALLECDEDGSVRKMRNFDGYGIFVDKCAYSLTKFCSHTPEEVAKAEFLSAFEPDDGTRRPDSAASMRTIKATFSNSSLVSSYSSTSSDSSDSDEDDSFYEQYPPPVSQDKETLRSALSHSKEIDEFLGILEVLSQEIAELDAMARYPEAGPSNLSVDDVEERLQLCRQDAALLLENLRLLVDKEFTDLESMKEVYDSLREMITRLESDTQENTLTIKPKSNPINAPRSRQPSLSLRTSYSTLRSGATTPSLVASGSSSSHSSFASFADLATPTDSPRFERRASPLGLNPPKSDEVAAEYFKGAGNELDFACAIAAGSFTRSRRASSALNLGVTELTAATPESPLEPGTDLASIPPEFASASPTVTSADTFSLGLSTANVNRASSASPRGARHESWLGPIVRQTNARTFQAHLENLIEIEKVLFGAEDAEREDGPHPGSGLLLEEDVQKSCWREGIEALHEVIHEVDEDEAGDFLEMAEAEVPQAGLEDFTSMHDETSTIQESPEAEALCAGPCSSTDIIYLAHKEALAVAEAILSVSCLPYYDLSLQKLIFFAYSLSEL